VHNDGRTTEKIIKYQYFNKLHLCCSDPFSVEDVVAIEKRIQMSEQRGLADQKVTMLSTTRAMLKEFHRKLNAELAALLDDDKFTWPELSTSPQDTNGQQTNQVLLILVSRHPFGIQRLHDLHFSLSDALEFLCGP